MVERQTIRVIVAGIIGVNPADIADDANLVELGLGSLEMMRLLSRWRRDGFAVSYQVLATDPTLNAWEQHFVMLERDGTDTQREPRHD